MKAPNPSETNPVFGEAEACLHCLVWEVIHAKSAKAANGQALYDGPAIVAGLSEVLAEIFASHPRPERRRLLAAFEHDLRAYVARKAASGEHPRSIPATGGLH